MPLVAGKSISHHCLSPPRIGKKGDMEIFEKKSTIKKAINVNLNLITEGRGGGREETSRGNTCCLSFLVMMFVSSHWSNEGERKGSRPNLEKQRSVIWSNHYNKRRKGKQKSSKRRSILREKVKWKMVSNVGFKDLFDLLNNSNPKWKGEEENANQQQL